MTRGSALAGVVVVLLLILGPAGRAQQPDASAKPLSNQDVLSLVQAGLPDAVIIEKIRTSPTAFDTSTEALIALQKASVSTGIIQLMVNPKAEAAPRAAAVGLGVASGTPEPCAPLPGGQLPWLSGASPAMWYADEAGGSRVEIQYERGTLHKVGFMGIGATLLLLKPLEAELRLPGTVVFYSCLNPSDTPLVRFTIDGEEDERHTSWRGAVPSSSRSGSRTKTWCP